MKNILFQSVIICFLLSIGCSKTNNNPDSQNTVKPNLDFSANKIYTPSSFMTYRVSEKCSPTTPYWENKTLTMRGYVSQININVRDGNFFLYENDDYKSDAIGIYIRAIKDTAKVSTFLLSNKNKYCTVKFTCVTGQIISDGCTNSLGASLMSLDDIKFE